MEQANVSSQEKLDQMLRDGKITEEDYHRLSRAMKSVRDEPNGNGATATERGKLRKSMENGWVGGLCAGYAEYFGVDERLIRTILIIAFVLLSALGGIGLALIPLYFVLCALTPWDEEEKAKAFLKSGRPRLFMGAVAGLFFILPLLYSVLCLPGLKSLYSGMGIEVWSALLQSTFAGRAIDCASEYRYWLSLNGGAVFVGLGFVTSVMLFLWIVHRSLCRERVRKYYAIAAIGLGLAWILFLVVGTLYPLVISMERL